MESKTIIYFLTSSKVKFEQYSSIFSEFNISLSTPSKIPNNIIEPQIENAHEANELIVSNPLKSIARFIIKQGCTPLMIEDTMLVINAFTKKSNSTIGLPGPDTKNWWKNLGNEGVLHFLKNEHDRTAFFLCTIGMILEDGSYIYASYKMRGEISVSVKESERAYELIPKTNPFFFHKIFIPENSTKTYATMGSDEFIKFDYRRKCVEKLIPKIGRLPIRKPYQLKLFEKC